MITHLDGCPGEGPECICIAEWTKSLRHDTRQLAETMRDASDAGVPHALILPQLVFVFRETFGEMPAGFAIPGMPS
jgi:hypothetical protein